MDKNVYALHPLNDQITSFFIFGHLTWDMRMHPSKAQTFTLSSLLGKTSSFYYWNTKCWPKNFLQGTLEQFSNNNNIGLPILQLVLPIPKMTLKIMPFNKQNKDHLVLCNFFISPAHPPLPFGRLPILKF